MSLLSFWDINSLMYHFVLYILKLTMKTCWFRSILYGIYPLCIYIMLWMPVILNFINTYLLYKIMTFRVEWTVQIICCFCRKLCLNPSIHINFHNNHNFNSMGSNKILLATAGTRHAIGTCMQTTHTHKSK